MTTVAKDEKEIRARLKRLGARRERQMEHETALATEVEDALREAYGVISVAEAARILKLHRTTVYRVYRPQG